MGAMASQITSLCLLNCLFRRRSKKTAKLRVTGLTAGNSPVTGEFPAQKTSNAENVSIWWRHRVVSYCVAYCCKPWKLSITPTTVYLELWSDMQWPNVYFMIKLNRLLPNCIKRIFVVNHSIVRHLVILTQSRDKREVRFYSLHLTFT